MPRPFAACVLLLASPAFADDLSADDVRTRPSPFLESHCVDCHAGESAEAGLDLTAAGTDLRDAATAALWERVHDRVRDGEMPPAEMPRPAGAETAAFLAGLSEPLTVSHAARKGTVLRRLNRREYANTLNDLFGTHLDLAERLPEDGRAAGFDTVGESLSLSPDQLAQYLAAIDAVLDAAIADHTRPPEVAVTRASYADGRDAEKFLGEKWLELPDGAVAFFCDWGYPDGSLRGASVKQSGRYRVRITGYAHQSDAPVIFRLEALTYARGVQQPTLGYFELPPGRPGEEPATVELEAWIEDGYRLSLTPQGLDVAPNVVKNTGLEHYRGPGLAISRVELEGPLTDEFPSRGHRLIFDGIDRRAVEPRNPRDKAKPWYRPTFEVDSDGPAADARQSLRRVATAAFRRPVTDAEVAPFVDLFASELDGGAAFEPALRTAVAAIFCSPRFLYLIEPPGELDDHALAARLSYVLTRTAPDDTLRAAADAGRLTADPAELGRQTERLLNDPRFDRFVTDFTDGWLDLREIEFTNPDERLFPEFDPYLQHSMLAESRAFFRELVERDEPVAHLVRPDFALLNERLVEHYGLGDAVGDLGPDVRRVPLPADSVRGGVLGQGAVLKVSANGTNTSPVVRGVWVNERLLGFTPPPPPPGIPGVEPDVRGATTLRELLDRHRDSDSCRACHRVIDPPGFALEAFDPVGGFRDRFRSLGDGEKVDLELRGRRVRYRLGPPVDATGELPDGRRFAGVREFHDLLADDPDVLARTLLVKLLTFATGREPGFSDRAEIDRLVAESAARGHGVRSLLHAAVGSRVFREK